MAQFANMFVVDLNNRSYPVSLVQTVSEGNVYSNRIGAYVYKDGAPVNLGGACTGLVMRADGTTVPLTGYVDGNAAYVVLDQPSCAIPGPIQVAVNSVVGENITTLLVAYGTVINTDTRSYVEPGTPLPDITELLAEIDNMREATAAAEAAATKAVRYDAAQSLTTTQKTTARGNIDAASDTDIKTNYVGFRGYLTSSDDLFALDMGSYGISPNAGNKPANMPAGFPSNVMGFVIVLESEYTTTNVAICAQAYAKRIWMRTGYDWVEMAKTDYVGNQIDQLYSSLYDHFASTFAKTAEGVFSAGSEYSSTKTQYKFLSTNGVNSVGDPYSDWYVTNEISVAPLSFYFVTASAQYNEHMLYNILDGDGNIIAYEMVTSSSAVSVDKKLILTPYNAAKIQIASITGASGAALYAANENQHQFAWVGKKWVCIGDSLTDVNIRTTKHYYDYVAEKTGITVVELGEGGTGYKREYAGEGPFIDRVDQIPLDADVVTIFGSGNDAIYTIGDPSDTGTDSLCSAINATIAAIFNRKTTCQLGIVTPCPWESYNPADETNWMARYSAAIVEICKRWGVPCLDLYHCSNLRPWDSTFRAAAYSKDDGNGVHPDETGHALIAPHFQAFLDSLLLH